MSWTQIEKQASAYRRMPIEKSALALDKILRRSQSFLDNLTKFFVRPLPEFRASNVEFEYSADGVYGPRACAYNEEKDSFALNPVVVLELWEDWRGIELPEDYDSEKYPKEDRLSIRLAAYQSQMAKLPSQWFAFLLLFQEMGRVLNVRNPEHRRASQKVERNAEELEYTNLLWGFGRLESMYSRLMGGNLRADMGICWFEGKWVMGR